VCGRETPVYCAECYETLRRPPASGDALEDAYEQGVKVGRRYGAVASGDAREAGPIIAGLEELARQDGHNGAQGETCRKAAALLRALVAGDQPTGGAPSEVWLVNFAGIISVWATEQDAEAEAARLQPVCEKPVHCYRRAVRAPSTGAASERKAPHEQDTRCAFCGHEIQKGDWTCFKCWPDAKPKP